MVKDADAKILFMDDQAAAAMGDAATNASAKRIALDDGGFGGAFFGVGDERRQAAAGDGRSGLDLQHHLFVGHDRHAEGHRAFAPLRWRQYGPARSARLWPRRGHAAVDAALFQHHAGLLQSDARRRRHRGADEEVRRARFLELSEKYRVTHAMLVPVQYRRIMALPDFDQLRSVVLRHEVLDLGAILRGDQGRRAEALAGRADGILRHDRGRRLLHAARARASRQAAHRRPADAGPRNSIDGRGRQAGRAGRDRRNRRPLAGDHEGVSQPARQDRRDVLARRERQALRSHRRCRTFRRGRLPDPDGPQEGHDHFRRLQHLSERSRGGADAA